MLQKVAISDTSTSIAIPYNVFTRTASELSTSKIGKQLAIAIDKCAVQAAVVGVPYSDAYRSRQIMEFVDVLWRESALQVPIVLQDESFSTYEVVATMQGREDIVNHQKMIRRMSPKQKQKIDKYSACVILKRGLEQVDKTFEQLAKQPNWLQNFELYKQRLAQHDDSNKPKKD